MDKWMSECVVLVGRKKPVPGRAAETSKMVASRRSNIKGKGRYRRQRPDIWDGVGWDRWQGGRGGCTTRIDRTVQTVRTTHAGCLLACFEYERERELVYVYNACVIASWGGLAD